MVDNMTIAAGFLVGGLILSTTGVPATAGELPAMTSIAEAKERSEAKSYLFGSGNGTFGLTSAERVQRLREQSLLSAQQLSRLFGVSRRTVNNWISGRPMSEENLKRLAKVESQILGFSGSPEERRVALFSLASDGGLSVYEKLRAEVRGEPLQAVGIDIESQLGTD